MRIPGAGYLTVTPSTNIHDFNVVNVLYSPKYTCMHVVAEVRPKKSEFLAFWDARYGLPHTNSVTYNWLVYHQRFLCSTRMSGLELYVICKTLDSAKGCHTLDSTRN